MRTACLTLGRTVMAGKLREHWQDGKTLQECNLHLIENEYSDITFRLYYKGSDKEEKVADIPALRLLCLARSPVFYAMFNGELAQQADNKVFAIHDDHADPDAFKQMIRFMYSDNVALTANNVLAILYLSQKYIISTLTKHCIQFLEESLAPNTAPVLLEQSMLYEEKELKEKTLKTIEEEAPAVLASDEFLSVSNEALGEMLNLSLKIRKEVTVFEACMKWAKNQCQKMKKAPSGENIREVLGKNLYLIRFPTMSPSEFADVVAPQDVLTGDEGYKVFRYIISDTKKPENLSFQAKHRDPGPRSLVIPAPYFEISGTLEDYEDHSQGTSISCRVSKPLCLSKIYILASTECDDVMEELTVTVKQDGKCLHHYVGKSSHTSRHLPEHYAVGVENVRVESGVMEIIITLRFESQCYYSVDYTISHSSPKTNQLSDDYVTITFPPVNENLLLGIEYCMP